MLQSVDGHRILRQIATSEMSTVYLATHKNLGRPVVIKVLQESLAHDPDFRRRFENEIHAMADLAHGNVVRVLDAGQEGDLPFLVMEYVDGLDLRRILDFSKRGVPPALTLAVLQEVATGLHAAHQLGVVHRDIKPGNVMVSRSGEIKVLDFGLVRRQASLEPPEESVSATGTRVLGTRGYMAPEQSHGQTVDERTDVFALGRLAHELLAGKRPSEADRYGEGLPGPASIGEMVRKMVAPDPQERPRNMSVVAKALRGCMKQSDRMDRVSDPAERREWFARLARNPRTALVDFESRPAAPVWHPLLVGMVLVLSVVAFGTRLVGGEVEFAVERGQGLEDTATGIAGLVAEVRREGSGKLLATMPLTWEREGALASVRARVSARERRELKSGRMDVRLAHPDAGPSFAMDLPDEPGIDDRRTSWALTSAALDQFLDQKRSLVVALRDPESGRPLADVMPRNDSQLQELDAGVYRAEVRLVDVLFASSRGESLRMNVRTREHPEAWLSLAPQWFTHDEGRGPPLVPIRRGGAPPPKAPPGSDPDEGRGQQLVASIDWTFPVGAGPVAAGASPRITWISRGVAQTDEVEVRITRADGSTVRSWSTPVSAGGLDIPTDGLAPGRYSVTLSTPGYAQVPGGSWRFEVAAAEVTVRLGFRLDGALLGQGTVTVGERDAQQDARDRQFWTLELLPGRYPVRLDHLRIPGGWESEIEVGPDGFQGVLDVQP